MKETFENYTHWFTLRKNDLTSIVFERTNGIVVDGPFKGMKILPKGAWGDGHPASKILGLYECELYPYVEEAISRNPDLILNIGSAEGFYGLGLALRTGVKTVLIDTWDVVLNIARENARENNLNRVLFSTDSSIPNYQHYLSNAERPFVVVDCEGGELHFLDPALIPELSKSIILVESHDCVTPGITNTLVQRFSDTHTVHVISQGAKNPHIDILKDDFSDYDKMILCCEERPSTMYWLYMVPNEA